MRRQRSLKAAVRGLAVLLAVTTTLLCASPRQGWAMLAPAETAGQAAPALEQRAADVLTVQKAMDSEAVRQRLKGFGLDEREAQARLSKLSDAEVHQLAGRISMLGPGGDGGFVIGVLVVAVLVLLIVYLVKRV